MRKRTNQLMNEDRKRQAKAWALVSAGDMDSEEHMRNIEDEISKGQCSSGKQMHFCIHHNTFNCKHAHRECVNEIGVNVLEEPGSHDYDAMLEDHKVGLPNHAKERVIARLETNESISPKTSHAKFQAEEMTSSAMTRKFVNKHVVNLRKIEIKTQNRLRSLLPVLMSGPSGIAILMAWKI